MQRTTTPLYVYVVMAAVNRPPKYFWLAQQNKQFISGYVFRVAGYSGESVNFALRMCVCFWRELCLCFCVWVLLFYVQKVSWIRIQKHTRTALYLCSKSNTVSNRSDCSIEHASTQARRTYLGEWECKPPTELWKYLGFMYTAYCMVLGEYFV